MKTNQRNETYKFNMPFFENGIPGEPLQFLTNSNKSIEGTVTTAVAVRINFIHAILRGEALREFIWKARIAVQLTLTSIKYRGFYLTNYFI